MLTSSPASAAPDIRRIILSGVIRLFLPKNRKNPTKHYKNMYLLGNLQ